MQALLSTCTAWRSRSSARPATATATATEAEAATQTRPSQALPLPLPLPRWRSLQAAAACSLLLLYKPRESGQATRILPHSLSLHPPPNPTHTHTTNPLSNCACLCRRHTLSAACPLSRCFLCCCCWRHCSIELDSARDAGSGRGRGAGRQTANGNKVSGLTLPLWSPVLGLRCRRLFSPHHRRRHRCHCHGHCHCQHWRRDAAATAAGFRKPVIVCAWRGVCLIVACFWHCFQFNPLFPAPPLRPCANVH